MKHIPNFITSLNLVCGFTAIILASHVNLTGASWFILAAMIFDFLDGFSARLLKAYSPIGKELDSLADVVSFGVAPGIIIYNLLVASLSIDQHVAGNGFSSSMLIPLLISAVMPVCGAIRLAIFNIDTTQATSFKGLPIPANALAVISLVLAVNYSHSDLITSFTESAVALSILTVILSILMVTRLPLFSLKVKNLKFKGNEARYLLICLIIISLVVLGPAAITLIIPFYIFSSLMSFLF